MRKFRVIVKETTFEYYDVEAENENDARVKGLQIHMTGAIKPKFVDHGTKVDVQEAEAE